MGYRYYLGWNIMVGLMMNCMIHAYQGEQKLPVARVTVFVHGSVFSGFSMFNLQRVFRDDLTPTCRYVRCITQLRNNPVLFQEQCMLGLGLQEIPLELLAQVHAYTLDEESKKRAAYGIAAVYDTLTEFETDAPTHRYYYAFGHLGLLSHTYRLVSAHELYDALLKIYEEFQARYERVEIHLIAHSHGGNICLNLATCQEEKKGDLRIDLLCMYGTPIQEETIGYALHPLFNKIINCWSSGDVVQVVDGLSTKKRRSYHKLSDNKLSTVVIAPHVYDVRLVVNKNFKHIDHANMWLVGRSNPLDVMVAPLPFMAFTPLLIASMKKVTHTGSLDAYLRINKDSVAMVLIPDTLAVTCELEGATTLISTQTMQQLTHLMKSNWTPADNQSSALMNGKAFIAIRDGLTQWWRSKKNGQ